MKIYIKCSKESEAYRPLVMKALVDAGHEVQYATQVRNDAAGKAGCDVCIEPLPTPVAAPLKVDVRIQKMVLVIGKATLPRRAIVDGLHLKQKSRAVFINNYLKPAVSQGLVTMTCPAHPNLPEQAYRLTANGLDLYAELTKLPH